MMSPHWGGWRRLLVRTEGGQLPGQVFSMPGPGSGLCCSRWSEAAPMTGSLDPLGSWRWSRWFLGRLGGVRGSDRWLPVRCRWADVICGGLPEDAPAGWRPAGRPRLVTDAVDQVGHRVHDPRGQEREPP